MGEFCLAITRQASGERISSVTIIGRDGGMLTFSRAGDDAFMVGGDPDLNVVTLQGGLTRTPVMLDEERLDMLISALKQVRDQIHADNVREAKAKMK